MSNKSKDAKLAWETMRQDELRQYVIVILKKTTRWTEEKSFFGDNPEDAACFIWGRFENNYQLFIRGREYKWAAQRGDVHLIKHLEYCIKFDQDFFKDPELNFPQGETFVTKKDLSSAEE
jgi:hypothetical protein